SPRMVSGACCASSLACAMASRTPKHIPKCSARIILIYDFRLLVAEFTLWHKVIAQKFLKFPLRFPLLHNFLQGVDVFPKRRLAFGSQCVSRLRPATEFLGD